MRELRKGITNRSMVKLTLTVAWFTPTFVRFALGIPTRNLFCVNNACLTGMLATFGVFVLLAWDDAFWRTQSGVTRPTIVLVLTITCQTPPDSLCPSCREKWLFVQCPYSSVNAQGACKRYGKPILIMRPTELESTESTDITEVLKKLFCIQNLPMNITFLKKKN